MCAPWSGSRYGFIGFINSFLMTEWLFQQPFQAFPQGPHRAPSWPRKALLCRNLACCSLQSRHTEGPSLGGSHLWSFAHFASWLVWSSIFSDFSGSSARVSAVSEAGPLPAPNQVLSVLCRLLPSKCAVQSEVFLFTYLKWLVPRLPPSWALSVPRTGA